MDSVRTAAPPAELALPDGFRCWPGDPAEDNMGPFYFRQLAPASETALRLERRHCNMLGIAHGGLLMAFADYTLCLAAIENQQQACVTVSCDNQFIASGREGDLLIGRGQLIRRTRSLAFVRADLLVDDRIVVSSTAVLKMFPLEVAQQAE